MKRDPSGLLPLLLIAFALAVFFGMFPVPAHAEARDAAADAGVLYGEGENRPAAENGGDPDLPAEGNAPSEGASAPGGGSFTLVIAAIIAVAAVILILLMIPGKER